MANTLKHIKKVHAQEGFSNLQLLFEFLIGEDMPPVYDAKLTYKPKQFVVHHDDRLNRPVVFLCKSETTGIFNPDKWERISIKEFITENHISLGDSDDITMISEEPPVPKNNRTWLVPVDYKSLDTGNLGNTNLMVIFNGDEFRGQDDEPDEENVKIWFDYEFDME